MDSNARKIDESKRKVISLCTKLQWVFFVAFGLYAIAALAIAAFTLFAPEGFEQVGTSSPLLMAAIACDAISWGFAIFLIGYVFREISKGGTPFSGKTSKALKVLAAILFAEFVMRFLIPPGTEVGVIDGASAMTFNSTGKEGDLANVEIGPLLASIVCLSLSTIFNYGSLLQDETDNLV